MAKEVFTYTKMKINGGTFAAVAITVVMLIALLGMLPTLITSGATSVHNLSDNLAGQGAVIGTDAASFAGNIDTYTGWFWVVGPFILILLAVLGVFGLRGRGGSGRGYRRYR